MLEDLIIAVNLTDLAFSIGALQAEQLASNIIKNKTEKENLIQGATFNILTGGNPIQITVGISDLKSERTKSANMMPFQMLLTLQTVLELSKAGTQVLVSSLKSLFGPNCITKNIFGKLEELQSYVESFYTAELVEFREKAGSKIDCN